MTNVVDERIRVLIVEDNPDDVSIMRGMLSQYRHARFEVQTAPSAANCVERLRQGGADVLLLDYVLPTEDGLTFLRRVVSRAALPPVIVVTGQRDPQIVEETLRLGAYYLSKDRMTPSTLGSCVEQALKSFHRQEELSRFDDQIMIALAAAAEGRDRVTASHMRRLAHWSVRLGRALDFEEMELRALHYGALLHDIGKLAIQPEVLTKAGPLTEEEVEEVRQHPIVGERICSSLSLARQVGPIVRHHHERWDGTGYVDGLVGDEIPLGARIVSAADAFDAMSHERAYRRALPLSEVVRRLEAGAGSQWDPDVIETFIGLITEDKGEGRRPDVWKAVA